MFYNLQSDFIIMTRLDPSNHWLTRINPHNVYACHFVSCIHMFKFFSGIFQDVPKHGLSTSQMETFLSGMEKIMETLKYHTVMLNSIQNHLRMPDVQEFNDELPEDIQFPLASVEDVNALEEKLKDASIKKLLASVL